jgi:FkbM family methyltransferase
MPAFLSPRSPLLCARGPAAIGEYCYYSVIFSDSLRGALPPRLAPLAPLLRRAYLSALFLLGAPWLLSWWGARRYAGCFRYYVLQNRTFEMDYGAVLARLRPRGVLHVGASLAQEAREYAAAGVRRVLWLEAQPALEAPLRAAVAAVDREFFGAPPDSAAAGPEVHIAAASDVSGRRVRMLLTSNSISSSLLPLGRGHKAYFPFIQPVAQQDAAAAEVETITVAELFKRRKVEKAALDFAYLDTQGSELAVLRGCGDALLRQLRAILTEVSTEEHYEGGCTMDELDAFLGARGFTRTVTHLPPLGHGNALYERDADAVTQV